MKSVFCERLYDGRTVKEKQFLHFSGTTIRGVSKQKRGELVGEYAVVTPAFIDPHSHIGMMRAGEPMAESDGNDHLDSIMPLPDALDSVQMDDPSFQEAIESGVLYSCVLPGSGNIVSGLSAVIRHHAPDSSAALVARAGVKCAFGYNPTSTVDWKGKRPSTRMGVVSLLRAKLHEVKQKEQKRKAAGKKAGDIHFKAEEAVLRDVLAGKTCLRVHVHKIDDIASLLRVVDEFKIQVKVEHAGDVHRPEIYAELKRRGIAVTYGPVDGFPYKVELKHSSWRNIRFLVESGVDFGLMTDHPVILARNLLYQAMWFLRCGLTTQQVLELLTYRNARILGIEAFLGSLEKGKWASFVCWNGDPFDLRHYPVAVFGEGSLWHRED